MASNIPLPPPPSEPNEDAWALYYMDRERSGYTLNEKEQKFVDDYLRDHRSIYTGSHVGGHANVGQQEGPSGLAQSPTISDEVSIPSRPDEAPPQTRLELLEKYKSDARRNIDTRELHTTDPSIRPNKTAPAPDVKTNKKGRSSEKKRRQRKKKKNERRQHKEQNDLAKSREKETQEHRRHLVSDSEDDSDLSNTTKTPSRRTALLAKGKAVESASRIAKTNEKSKRRSKKPEGGSARERSNAVPVGESAASQRKGDLKGEERRIDRLINESARKEEQMQRVREQMNKLHERQRRAASQHAEMMKQVMKVVRLEVKLRDMSGQMSSLRSQLRDLELDTESLEKDIDAAVDSEGRGMRSTTTEQQALALSLSSSSVSSLSATSPSASSDANDIEEGDTDSDSSNVDG